VRAFIIAGVMLVSTAAFGQQPVPASNMALQINTAVSNMALELDQARQVNAALQKQLVDAQARIKELEPKVDEKVKK
jgi:hypothetical protein